MPATQQMVYTWRLGHYIGSITATTQHKNNRWFFGNMYRNMKDRARPRRPYLVHSRGQHLTSLRNVKCYEKSSYTHRQIKKVTWQHKNATKNSSTHRLRTGSWVGERTASQLVKIPLSLSLFVTRYFSYKCDVIYVTAQMCKRTEEEKKLYLRSCSQRHRYFAGFLHRHGTTLFIGCLRHSTPSSRLLRHAGDTEDVFPVSSRGTYNQTETCKNV